MSTDNNNTGKTPGLSIAPTTPSGTFARSYVSLQLQMNTLLEESGGSAAVGLLDALSALNRSEQARAIEMCTKAVRRIAESEERFESAEDAELRSFEEGLYNDIVAAMKDAACGVAATINGTPGHRSGPVLAVVNGGKTSRATTKIGTRSLARNKTLDLDAARRARITPEIA